MVFSERYGTTLRFEKGFNFMRSKFSKSKADKSEIDHNLVEFTASWVKSQNWLFAISCSLHEGSNFSILGHNLVWGNNTRYMCKKLHSQI